MNAGPTALIRDKKPAVTIVFFEGYLGVQPSLVSAIRLLAAEGFDVTVLTRRPPQHFGAAPDLGPRVSISYARALGPRWGPGEEAAPTTSDDDGGARRLMRNVLMKVTRTGVELVDLVSLASLAWRHAPKHGITCGVDMYGLAPAALAAWRAHLPLAYWSLEIVLLSETRNPLRAVIKLLERPLSRRCDVVIVQDEHRATTLARENGIGNDRFVHVPNAPIGHPRVERGRMFHVKYALQPDTKVILHAGMIGPAVRSMELAEAAASWPDTYVLILHERRRRDENEPYLRTLSMRARGRLRLSLEPLPFDELDELYASADVGIALYDPARSPSYRHVASASGKLLYYLRAGLPVVVSDDPTMRALVDAFGCGSVVSHPREIGRALEAIFAEYPRYRDGALRCYQERYELGNHFAKLVERFRTLASS